MERDVERGKCLHRDTLPADRGGGPEELLPDAAGIQRVLANEQRGELLGVREQRGPASALAVAEANALEAIGGRDLRDHDIHVAERSLPTGRDLCVGHRLIQRNPIERAADLRDGGARPDERCRLRHATSLRK